MSSRKRDVDAPHLSPVEDQIELASVDIELYVRALQAGRSLERPSHGLRKFGRKTAAVLAGGVRRHRRARFEIFAEQRRFGFVVVLHRPVKVEVLGRQIGENGAVVKAPAQAPLRDAVRRTFHGTSLAAVVDHILQKLLDFAAFGRRAVGEHRLGTVVVNDRSQQAAFDAAVLQDAAHHVAGGAFALRPRDGEHFHFLGRLFVQSRSDISHRRPDVGYLDPRDRQSRNRALNQKIRHAGFQHLFDETMPVRVKPHDAGKNISRADGPGVAFQGAVRRYFVPVTADICQKPSIFQIFKSSFQSPIHGHALLLLDADALQTFHFVDDFFKNRTGDGTSVIQTARHIAENDQHGILGIVRGPEADH